jgi:hypothetical protein
MEAALRMDGGEDEDRNQDRITSRESKTVDPASVGRIWATGAESGRWRGGWERRGSTTTGGGRRPAVGSGGRTTSERQMGRRRLVKEEPRAGGQ